MADSKARLWQSLTAPEAELAAERDPVVILPLAAIEQHGPHLPLSTDLEIGLGLVEHAFGLLADELPVWALPPIAVGASAEHSQLPGTLHVGARALARSIRGLGASLARCGVRRLVLSNSHGGNLGAMDAAGLWLRAEHRMLVVKASYFRFARPRSVDLPESEWVHGLHGGAVETAMMLHLRRELVRTEAIGRFASLGEELERSMRRVGPQGEAAFAWMADDLNEHGVAGDATLASAELGRSLVEHYGRALADVVLDARDFPLDRLRGRAPAP